MSHLVAQWLLMTVFVYLRKKCYFMDKLII